MGQIIKDSILKARCTKREKEMAEELAKAEGLNYSEWIRYIIRREHEKLNK